MMSEEGKPTQFRQESMTSLFRKALLSSDNQSDHITKVGMKLRSNDGATKHYKDATASLVSLPDELTSKIL